MRILINSSVNKSPPGLVAGPGSLGTEEKTTLPGQMMYMYMQLRRDCLQNIFLFWGNPPHLEIENRLHGYSMATVASSAY